VNVLQLISSGIGYYGAERVVVTLSAALEDLDVNTVVGAFLNTTKTIHLEVLDQARLRGLKTERIPCHGRFDWQAVLAIRSIIERHKIEIIHCHGIKPDLYAFFAARHFNIPLVSTCHLWTFDSKRDWLVSALERCILHGLDRVVVVSDHIIPQLRRFGVRADVIYNGIDLAPFSHPAFDFKMKMKWCGRPIVGVVGRLAPQKGLQNLLRAAPEVLRDTPNALFVIVGDGPERQILEADAKALGIRDSVCFLGVRQDIPEILSSMDVLAMPSLDEGLPMALLEAMASGRAVVASSVGGIPRVIQNRVNGIIVSPGDVNGLAAALRDLLKHGDFRTALGKKARETVELRFSAASMAMRYLEVYSGVPSRV
jgi:glycosyltransferase involved in cell wall biosynthesis